MIKRLVHNNFKKMKSEGRGYSPNLIYLLKNFLFNADGTLRAFPQFRKLIALERPHSLYRLDESNFLVCSDYYFVDKLYLYKKDTNTLTFLTDLWQSYRKVWYARMRDYVFISNRFGKLIYNIKDRQVIPWVSSERISFDDVGEASDYAFVDVIDFPNCERIVSFLGRVWGVRDNVLWYTEPIFCTCCKATNYIEFPDKIIGLSASPKSLLILLPNEFYIGIPSEKFLLDFVNYQIDGIIADSCVNYRDEFIFLCRDGIVYVKGGEYTIINKGVVSLFLSGVAETFRVGEGEYLIGGEGFRLQFRDNADAEIIRLKK